MHHLKVSGGVRVMASEVGGKADVFPEVCLESCQTPYAIRTCVSCRQPDCDEKGMCYQSDEQRKRHWIKASEIVASVSALVAKCLTGSQRVVNLDIPAVDDLANTDGPGKG